MIAARIDDACKSVSPCTINIKDVTDFQWDKMYAFKYHADLEQIEEALGVKFPLNNEFTRKLVFLKEGKVVYSEEAEVNVEHLEAGEVIFDMQDMEVYKMYTADAARFKAEKKESDYGSYYLLSQMN